MKKNKKRSSILKIIALSDIHGVNVDFARLYTAVKEEIEADKKTDENIEHLFVVAGDVFSANKLLSKYSEGDLEVKALCKLAGLFRVNRRVFVPGNHDFIYGWKKLGELLEQGNFQLLVSNAEFSSEVGLNPVRSIKLSIGSEMKEFRGLMTPETNKSKEGKAALKSIINTKDLKLEDFGGILISHLGLQDDRLLKTKADVIGGHSHHEDHEITMSGRFIINLGAHSRLYSSIVIPEKDRVGTEVILMYTGHYDPATEITGIIQEYEMGVEKHLDLEQGKLSEVVFRVPKESKMLSGLDALEDSYDLMESHLRLSDSCVTRLTADAISKKCGTIALVPAAAFRSNFVPGQNVTMRELMEMYYWDNMLVKVKTTGAELIKALARGVLSQPKNWHGRGRLLHPSSQLEYTYDLENQPENIITDVKYLGEPINPDETYEIVSTNWIVETCNLFPNAEVVKEFDDRISFVVGEFAKDCVLSESFSERISCPQNLQWQEALAQKSTRGEYHENPNLEINLEQHYKNFNLKQEGLVVN